MKYMNRIAVIADVFLENLTRSKVPTQVKTTKKIFHKKIRESREEAIPPAKARATKQRRLLEMRLKVLFTGTSEIFPDVFLYNAIIKPIFRLVFCVRIKRDCNMLTN
jgi:hypothetical protein